MMIIDKNIDSLLFDMDGTLWNATDSYAEIWNRCFADCGIDICITGNDLVSYMGKPIEIIVNGITGGAWMKISTVKHLLMHSAGSRMT